MLTYEDQNSIVAKGRWVRATGAGGAIVWTMNYGSADGCTDPPMNAMRGSSSNRHSNRQSRGGFHG